MPRSTPNVVFFFADDQRFDTIGALGNTAIKTPNIDRLVRAGVSFTRAHIPCGTSGAVCMPSRAMLHTGRSLFHLQGAGESIPTAHTMLGEALRRNGYRTFGAGKWHNGTEAFQRSFTDGDEIFFGGMADHWNVPVYHYDPSGRYDHVCPWIEAWQTDNTVKQRRCDHIHAGRHSSEIIADAGLAFLRQRTAQDAPFFMYLSFLAPHDPRSMPQEYLDMYPSETLTLPPNVFGGHPFDTGALHIRDELLASFPRTPETVRRHLADYYAMITHLDAHIGRVLDELDRQGLMDNTIIVFAGDNGLAVGQHGLMGKQNCYEHSVRVPLIIGGPGIPADVRAETYAYLFDVFPTLCDLTGTCVPDSVDGLTLVPVLRQPEECVRDVLYFAYTDLQRAVKNQHHKLIEYVVGGRHSMTQLFDIVDDPWELQNLAEAPEFAETVAEMRRVLADLRDAWDDVGTEWGDRFWQGLGAD